MKFNHTCYYIESTNRNFIVVEYQGRKYIEIKGISNRKPFMVRLKKKIEYNLKTAKIYGLKSHGLTKKDLIIKEIIL